MTPPNAVNASGINDKGNIVGQFTSGANTPGFILPSSTSNSFTTINQPTGITSDVINAQGINNNGLVVGFYLGNDGQVHGFTANAPASPGTSITATAVTDPTIPADPNEPGATFVFSQILDPGIHRRDGEQDGHCRVVLPPFTPRQYGNLYEIRAYTMQPSVTRQVVERWAERIKGRIKFSPLAAAGHTELGPLNQWIHIWAYKDANERTRIREESRRDGNRPPATRGMFIKQENMLVVPASFSPLR